MLRTTVVLMMLVVMVSSLGVVSKGGRRVSDALASFLEEHPGFPEKACKAAGKLMLNRYKAMKGKTYWVSYKLNGKKLNLDQEGGLSGKDLKEKVQNAWTKIVDNLPEDSPRFVVFRVQGAKGDAVGSISWIPNATKQKLKAKVGPTFKKIKAMIAEQDDLAYQPAM